MTNVIVPKFWGRKKSSVKSKMGYFLKDNHQCGEGQKRPWVKPVCAICIFKIQDPPGL
jgi:hypothetical protein